MIVLLIISSNLSAQNVGIGTNVPDSCAILDLTSLNKGLLIPRMSYVRRVAIHAPVPGLMVYQTDDTPTPLGMYTYTANGWEKCATDLDIQLNAPWTQSAGDLLFCYINAKVGIGTTFPLYKLDVRGNIFTSGDFIAEGDINVRDNKGVIINGESSSSQVQYTQNLSFSLINLAPHTTSAEVTVVFPHTFSSPPGVFLGNIITTGGTTGRLFDMSVTFYDVTTTGCHCRVVNLGDTNINQTCTWKVMLIGY